MNKEMTQEEKAQEMERIIDNGRGGTDTWYKHSTLALFPNTTYTDGIKNVAERMGAYWLLDAIFSYRRQEPFQVWNLKVTGSEAVLTMKEDTDQPILVTQEIPYTDFPEGDWTFWLIDNVLLLPSEY